MNGEFKVNGNGLALLPTGVSEQVPFDFSRHPSGLQLGLGMEAKVLSQLGLRVEWDVNTYQSFETPVIKQTGEREGDLRFRHPIVNQLKAGVTYHFNFA